MRTSAREVARGENGPVNAIAWVVSIPLAVVFAATGVLKLVRSREQLVLSGLGWAEDFSAGTVKLVGGLEILAAVGLVVPPLLGIAPVLAPLAALGLALVMIGAAVTHARRGETPLVVVNVALLLLATTVVTARLG